jgi:hypothetical protein
LTLQAGNTKGEIITGTIDLLFGWFGISSMTTDNFCFYLQNRLIQTSQTGGQWYTDTYTFSSIPCFKHFPQFPSFWAEVESFCSNPGRRSCC